MGTSDRLLDASDGILSARAADGDVAAFEVLVRRYGPMMRVFAMKVLGSDVESDDVVQEAFVQAWRHLGELEEATAVRPWLMRMVSNKAIERIRRRKSHLDIADWDAPAPQDQTPERIVEMRMQLNALSSALQKLPETQRQCWVLKELGGISYGEIASELEMPLSTVRGQLARARRTVIQEMEGWR